MTISIELARGVYPDVTGVVSHEAIYQAVYAHGRRGLPCGLHTGLHRRRRCRKHRLASGETPATKAGPLGMFNLIGLRPPEADGRDIVGHLKGDLICGSFNRSAIVTLFDQASRYCWLADLPEGHSAHRTPLAVATPHQRKRQRPHTPLRRQRHQPRRVHTR